MAPMSPPQKNPSSIGPSAAPVVENSPRHEPSLYRGLGRLAPAVCGLGLLFASSTAEAKLFEVYLDGYLGGMYGTEPKQDQSLITQKPDMSRGNDFFHDQSGGLLGARLGIEVLYTDLYLQFDQFLTGQGLSGSTLQPMIGWDLDLGSGSWKALLGVYGGLVFGFPYTPHWPIDNRQIATVGVTAEGQGGAEYMLNRFLGLQFTATVGYHYMFAGAESVPVSVTGITQATQTQGFHLMFKGGVRFHIGL